MFALTLKTMGMAMATAVLTGCTNIDCPLDNLVEMTCGLYDSDTKLSLTLNDTLTITSPGTLRPDTTLLNRANAVSSFVLPMNETVDADTLLFHFSNADGKNATDTVFVSHTNEPHFESVDCPTAVFHTLLGVRWTSHSLSLMPLTIDSIAVVRKPVNYDNIENIKIYLRSSAAH